MSAIWTSEGYRRVKLLPAEVEDYQEAARLRNRQHRDENQNDQRVGGESSQGIDNLGAGGEKAVTVAFGLVWSGRLKSNKDFWGWRDGSCDVQGLKGIEIEVKTVSRANFPEMRTSLVLHKTSDPLQAHVLVVHRGDDVYDLVGWCYGHEGQDEKYWDSSQTNPCFMVPMADLRSVYELYQLQGIDVDVPPVLPKLRASALAFEPIPDGELLMLLEKVDV